MTFNPVALILLLPCIRQTAKMASKSEVAVRRKTLTRSASATNIIPVTKGQNSATTVKDYTLNKIKSLDKKNAGCLKEHMKCEVKQGNNVVVELSTAAYELAKICLHELFQNPDFSYFAERKDSFELQGANVDTCYKIYNKKSDGSCGKMLKFVINLYHTTSSMLVNGSKTEIFLTDIYNELCSLMASRCKQLDIINLNIADILSTINNSEVPKKTLTSNNPIDYNGTDENESIVTEETINDNLGDQDLADDTEMEEVCEICPVCQKPAYGKVVQCGECGDWYHYDCLKINDTTIQTLGDDDYVCRVCTDNLLSLDLEKSGTNNGSHTNEINEQISEANINTSETSSIINSIQPEPKDNQSSDRDNPTKNKSKKVTKPNKVKKDEIVDKSYIIELENQIKMLKSTIELQSKSQSSAKTETPVNQNHAAMKETVGIHTSSEECRHTCCKALNEKLQENRIRALETQMMQNMYIQNAMHIQLVSQMKTQVPDYHILPQSTGLYQQYGVPHHQPGFANMTRPPFLHQPLPMGVYQPPPTGMPYQTLPTAYTGVNLPRYPPAPPVHIPQPYGNVQHAMNMNHGNGTQHQPHTLYQPVQPTNLNVGPATNIPTGKPQRLPSRDGNNIPQTSTHKISSQVPSGPELQSKKELKPPRSKPISKENSKTQKRHSGSSDSEKFNEQTNIKKLCISNHNNDDSEHNPVASEQISLLSEDENSDNNPEIRNSFLSIPPVKHNPPGMIQGIQADEKRE